MDYFWSPNKGFTYGAKREGDEEEEEEGERRDQIKVWKLTLIMDSCIHEFGMIFVQEFLGYDC